MIVAVAANEQLRAAVAQSEQCLPGALNVHKDLRASLPIDGGAGDPDRAQCEKIVEPVEQDLLSDVPGGFDHHAAGGRMHA
ncbi:MAG: hypothetical protein IPH53_21410 [Flavobacteriales bacterium]|nr:hypothetical protein [Flavobacteriales bacterium]